MNKDLNYYLPKFLDIQLKQNMNVSENTIISYKYTFISLLQYMSNYLKKKIQNIAINDFNKLTIEEYLNYLELEKKNSISTRNQRLAAIKSFFNYLATEDLKYLNIANEISAIKTKKNIDNSIKYLSKTGIKEILSLPNTSTKNGVRDLAILTLLYDSAARVQELIKLKCCDINLEKKIVYLNGKGRKQRVVPLVSSTIKIINKYMKLFELNENSTNLLFFNARNEPLTRMGINYIINKYVSVAKNNNPIEFQIKVSPHTFRHSKAMHLLESGVNLIYIRDFLGHSSVTTTEIYAKTNPEIKRKAIEKHSENLTKRVHYTREQKDDLLEWLKKDLKKNSNF